MSITMDFEYLPFHDAAGIVRVIYDFLCAINRLMFGDDLIDRHWDELTTTAIPMLRSATAVVVGHHRNLESLTRENLRTVLIALGYIQGEAS